MSADAEVDPLRAAATVLASHQTVATGLGEWACKCSPMEWRPAAFRPRHLAAALHAAGLLDSAAENARLRTRLANVERDLRQHREMRAAADVVRVPLVGRAT